MSQQDETENDLRAHAADAPDRQHLDARREDDDGIPSVDQVIGTFLKETTLWPVLIVMLGTSGAFGGAMLVLTIVDRNPFAAAALVLLLGMTLDITFRARRETGLRNLAKLIALIWIVAFGFAGLAVWTGIAF